MPLGSEYVVSLRDVVWPFMVVEDEDVEKDWNVDEFDILVACGLIWVWFWVSELCRN